ncbi:MAG: galactose-1-epimerase, partial [Mesorhizobium sp.]
MAMKDGEVFGTTQAGEAVRRFTIRGGGLTANIIGLGAIVQDLRLNGHDAPLVLGYDRFEPYETDRAFF